MTTRFCSFLAIVLIFTATACYHVKSMSFSTSSGEIPPAFKGYNDTLLVIMQQGDPWYNKYLRNNFKDNYTGPYKIIKPYDLRLYPADQYRYLFDHQMNYSDKTRVSSTGMVSSSRVASSDQFYIKDRKTEQKYMTQSSAAYSKLMRAYIQALEAERKQ